MPEDDRGAQDERTLLAWTRTVLALVVTAALQLRFALDPVEPVAAASAALATTGAVVLQLAARRRYGRRGRRTGVRHSGAALLATAVVLLLCLGTAAGAVR